jgi:hypothetical protein
MYAARLGEHTGVTTKALTKTAPSRPMRSMFGVRTSGLPYRPTPQRAWSSVTTATRFGRSAADSGAPSSRPTASQARRNRVCDMETPWEETTAGTPVADDRRARYRTDSGATTKGAGATA